MGAEENKKEKSLLDKISGFWNKKEISSAGSKESQQDIELESNSESLNLSNQSKTKIEDKISIESEALIEIKTISDLSLINSIIDFSTSSIDSIKQSGITAIDFAKSKTEQAVNSSAELSQSISKTFVEFSTEIGNKYDDLEIKPKLLEFIYEIDLLKAILLIENAKNNQKAGSKERNALVILLSILYLFEKSKFRLDSEKLLISGEDENLNYDLELLLKSITLKDVVETVEPFLLIIPNGNYILLILKLFM